MKLPVLEMLLASSMQVGSGVRHGFPGKMVLMLKSHMSSMEMISRMSGVVGVQRIS